MNKLKSFFDIKFLKFILVGILNTLVGMGLQFVFYNVFGWDKYDWGVVLASLIGNIIGSVVSYFLNKYFTFKNKEKGWKPVLRFALNIAVCYAIAYLLVSPLVSWVSTANHWSLFGWSAPLSPATTSDNGSSRSERKRKQQRNKPRKHRYRQRRLYRCCFLSKRIISDAAPKPPHASSHFITFHHTCKKCQKPHR